MPGDAGPPLVCVIKLDRLIELKDLRLLPLVTSRYEKFA